MKKINNILIIIAIILNCALGALFIQKSIVNYYYKLETNYGKQQKIIEKKIHTVKMEYDVSKEKIEDCISELDKYENLTCNFEIVNIKRHKNPYSKEFGDTIYELRLVVRDDKNNIKAISIFKKVYLMMEKEVA
jgi:hypothetical protein